MWKMEEVTDFQNTIDGFVSVDTGAVIQVVLTLPLVDATSKIY